MARIELRDCTITLKDGLAGTAAANTGNTTPMSGATSLTINTVSLNTDITTKVPVGARFTIAGETANTTVHIVTARTNTGNNTTAITFSPALTAGSYANTAVLTFAPIELDIKIGEGELKYTESTDYKYDLDRGNLDTVREGDEAPMDVSLAFTYEHITTGTSENVSPMDALKRIGSASEWVSAASDKCEPYAVDVVVTHTVPCGTAEDERTTFPDFRSDKREISFKDALVTISGRCNATEPIVERGTF
jgi:proline racemase